MSEIEKSFVVRVLREVEADWGKADEYDCPTVLEESHKIDHLMLIALLKDIRERLRL